MRRLLFTFSLMFLAFPIYASNIYIAQSTAGAANAADCADARALSSLGSSNWSAGNTIHLCGTITSRLVAQGSGAAGNVITVLFESGANMTSPVWSPDAINLNGFNYILVDGGTNGIIQNTANGTGLANNVGSNGIEGGTSGACGHDIEIRNLQVLNIYVRTASSSDDGDGANNSGGISLGNSCGNNIHIHNNTSTWAHANIFVGFNSPGVSNFEIDHNTVANSTWGILVSTGGSNMVLTNLYVHDNNVNDGTGWQEPNDLYHIDGIFIYGQDPTGYINGVYVYNNYVYGDWGDGSHVTSWVYVNQNLQNVWYFNNVLVVTGDFASHGVLNFGYGNTSDNVINNTMVGYGGSSGGTLVWDTAGETNTVIENNIIIHAPGAINLSDGGNASISAIDYNDYFDVTATNQAGAWCASNCFSTLATWQSAGFDAHGVYADPKLNSTYQIQGGSAAAGIAQNLYGTCNGQPNPGLGALCFDKAGTPRPAAGNWDAGAYSLSQVGAPLPPTGLKATVQ